MIHKALIEQLYTMTTTSLLKNALLCQPAPFFIKIKYKQHCHSNVYKVNCFSRLLNSKQFIVKNTYPKQIPIAHILKNVLAPPLVLTFWQSICLIKLITNTSNFFV